MAAPLPQLSSSSRPDRDAESSAGGSHAIQICSVAAPLHAALLPTALGLLRKTLFQRPPVTAQRWAR